LFTDSFATETGNMRNIQFKCAYRIHNLLILPVMKLLAAELRELDSERLNLWENF